MTFGWRRIAFASFISRAHFKAQESAVKSLEWIIEDVFKRVEDVSNEKTGTGRIREVQLIPQFYVFLWKARKKAYACSMVLTKISRKFWLGSILKTETSALYPKRPAARNWRHLIKLCLALCWLFDVKRFVTLWLLSLIPPGTDTSDDYWSNSTLQPTNPTPDSFG